MAIDAWIVLAGTLLGGVGVKIAEHYLGRSKFRNDDAFRIRDELRLQIAAQREEIKELEAGLEKWRAEYYNLKDKHMQLQTELTIALERIKEEAHRLDNTP